MNKFASEYKVEEISNVVANEIAIKYHYLHRRSTVSKSYAMLRRDNDKIVGILQFGMAASPSVEKGICGEDEMKNVIELKRLFIFDETAKNAESWFIGQVFKLCPYEIIISFSEPKAGHLGIVYQSTNFLFCGATIPFKDYVPADGRHPKTIMPLLKQYGGGEKAYKALGEKVITIKVRDRKYRYIYFNVRSKKRRKELMAKLRYNVYAYPKTLNIEEWEKDSQIIVATTHTKRRKK